MKKMFMDKRKTCFAIAMLVLAVAVAGNFVINQTPDFPCSQDPDQLVSIEDGQVPLANIDVSSKTSKKTSTKKVKLKAASKKSYSKKLPKKTKTTTKKVTKTVSKEKVVTETKTIVETTTRETYKKASRIKTVKMTVKTTVNTTVTKSPAATVKTENSSNESDEAVANGASDNSEQAASSDGEASDSEQAASAGGGSTGSSDESNKATEGSSADGAYSVDVLASKADSRVRRAFKTLGFEIVVKSDVSYGGKYDTKGQQITLKRADSTVYHELGHFLAFIAGNMDTGEKFKAVYEAEKSKYSGTNRAYVTQNSSEYFAESFREYTLNPSALKSSRPKTYAKITDALELITDSRIAKYKVVYAPYWK